MNVPATYNICPSVKDIFSISNFSLQIGQNVSFRRIGYIEIATESITPERFAITQILL